MFLLEKTKLVINEEDEIFLGVLMKYQLQGRYPDYNPTVPGINKAEAYFKKTERMLTWFEEIL